MASCGAAPFRSCLKRLIRLSVLFLSSAPAWLAAHPGVDTALAYFSEQIRMLPGQQLPYIQRGNIYSNDGRYAQALADFQQAARLGEPLLVSFDLGVLYYRMGDFATARHYLDAFLDRYPDHQRGLEYRARLLRDAGEYRASVADFTHLFELRERPNPGDFSAVANMLASTGAEGIEQALAIIDQGHRKLGLTPQLQEQAIALELRRDRPDRAILRLRLLEPMLGESPQWKVDMADLLLQVGEPEQATALLDAAESQLDRLRRTPARLQIVEKIARMRQLPE